MATRSGRSIGGGYNNPPPIFYVDLLGVSDSEHAHAKRKPKDMLRVLRRGPGRFVYLEHRQNSQPDSQNYQDVDCFSIEIAAEVH